MIGANSSVNQKNSEQNKEKKICIVIKSKYYFNRNIICYTRSESKIRTLTGSDDIDTNLWRLVDDGRRHS